MIGRTAITAMTIIAAALSRRVVPAGFPEIDALVLARA